MSHYYFAVEGDDDEATDFECANDRAAWEEAVATCGEIIRRTDRMLDPGQCWRMLVSDDKGDKVFSLEFSSQCHRGTGALLN